MLLLTVTLGCGAGNFSSVAPVTAGAASAPPYHAYGDSITVGYPLPNPATMAYPFLLTAAKNLFLADRAISADQACDIPTRQIFPNADSPSTSSKTLYTVLIGTNDADAKGSGAYEAVFNLCDQASLAWLATPLESKVLASAATVSGASHIDTASGYNAVTTDAAAASLTFHFTRATPGAVYVWYRIVDANAGTFTVALDGGSPMLLTTGTTPMIATHNGSSSSLALLRLPGVAAGSHSLVLTQTSANAAGMSVVAIGMPATVRPSGAPRVLAGTVPLQLAGGGPPCDLNPAVCLAYTADVTANVALLASDGLDVELFDSRKYMTGTAADMADQVHPNALGHQEILHAILDIY